MRACAKSGAPQPLSPSNASISASKGIAAAVPLRDTCNAAEAAAKLHRLFRQLPRVQRGGQCAGEAIPRACGIDHLDRHGSHMDRVGPALLPACPVHPARDHHDRDRQTLDKGLDGQKLLVSRLSPFPPAECSAPFCSATLDFDVESITLLW